MTLTADTRGLYSVNVTDLTQGANVRADLRLTPEFVKSVKANGIIQPPIVYPDPDTAGRWRILAGHRRVAAAIKAGIQVIDVVIRDAPEDAGLVVDQLVENVHRDQLTDAEQASAYRQLAHDFGLPAVQISKRTATKLDRIGNAIKVASSPVAAKVIAEHQVTIDEALIFDEFADDQAALEQLHATLADRPDQLQHQAQQIRNDRAEQAEIDRVEQEIHAAGITLLEANPNGWGAPVGYKAVDRLYIGDDFMKSTKRLTVKAALAKAGDDLGARPGFVWRLDENDRRVKVWSIEYFVRNHRDHGWCSSDDKQAKAPLTDDEKTARRLARDNGKIWLAATQVRIEWVKKLLERRTLPADWHLVPALVLTDIGSGFHYRARDNAADYLGIPHPSWSSDGNRFVNTLRDTVTSNPGHATHTLLALAAGELEARWDEKQGWQHHTPTHRSYLQLLSSWGYPLSELEENITTALAEEQNS